MASHIHSSVMQHAGLQSTEAAFFHGFACLSVGVPGLRDVLRSSRRCLSACKTQRRAHLKALRRSCTGSFTQQVRCMKASRDTVERLRLSNPSTRIPPQPCTHQAPINVHLDLAGLLLDTSGLKSRLKPGFLLPFLLRCSGFPA